MNLKSLLWILLLIWIVGYSNLYFKELNHLKTIESFNNELTDDDSDDQIEGFTSQYQACRDKGLTKSFCNHNPKPGECITASGLKGRISKEFGGECIVGGEEEERIYGIGISSLDPSKIRDKESSRSVTNKLKQIDITTEKYYGIGEGYGRLIYKNGLGSMDEDLIEIPDPINIYRLNTWDNQYFSNI